MSNSYLDRPEQNRLQEKDIELFKEMLSKGSLTPIDIEVLYTKLSDNGQNAFLMLLKEFLPDKEWESVVIHFKALSLMDKGREKTQRIIRDMATAMYDNFNGGQTNV